MHRMARQKLLPFFLPMYGCPHQCVYCDQYAITGRQTVPSPEQVQRALASFQGGPQAELAYYGGSFTCLPRRTQAAYLQAAQPALLVGTIGGIRISTRPDRVDEDTCAFLLEQGVTTVELGIQSFCDSVLECSGRGYSGETAREACLRIRAQGFRLGIQLMTGLPGDKDEQARSSMATSLDLGADLLRIYPTLVLAGTELARLYRAGTYQPQSLPAAVALCKDLLALAIAGERPVQRMGLNPSPELERSLLAGPYHPAFGGLVREALRHGHIHRLLTDCDPARPGILRFPSRDLPLVFGQRRAGSMALAREFPLLALEPDESLPPGLLVWEQGSRRVALSEIEYCRSRRTELERMNGYGETSSR